MHEKMYLINILESTQPEWYAVRMVRSQNDAQPNNKLRPRCIVEFILLVVRSVCILFRHSRFLGFYTK